MKRQSFVKSLVKLANYADSIGDYSFADQVEDVIKMAHYVPDYRWVDLKDDSYAIGWTDMMDGFRNGSISGVSEASERMQRVDTLGDKYDLGALRKKLSDLMPV